MSAPYHRSVYRSDQKLDVITLVESVYCPLIRLAENAFAERFVRSIKEECLNRAIFPGQSSLRYAVTQYLSHYHGERNHQGLRNRLLIPSRVMGELGVPVKRHERLGGMLSYYHREAA